MQKPTDYASFFRFIAEIFERTETRSLVIGGYAVNQYNVSRQTADIDFMIASGDFDIVFKYLEEAGYRVEHKQEAFVQLSMDGSIMDIDFVLVERVTIDTMSKNGKSILISGCSFTIPSLNDLLALKLHSIKHNSLRLSRDLPDIVNLLLANGLSPESDDFKNLCTHYGTDDIFKRIVGDFNGK